MVAPFSVLGQEDWETLLFSGEEILRLSHMGQVETISVPEEAQNFVSGNTGSFVALSPDQRYFAFVTEQTHQTGFNSTLHIADLESDSCCTVIPTPDGQDWEVTNLGMFSPDSRYLVINFLNAYMTDTSGALVAVLDLTTGDYVNVIDPYEMFNTNALFFISWVADGIEVIPTCFPCGASADGHTILWDPVTNDLTMDYRYHASYAGDRLANGDIIEAVQDDRFPIGEADVMVGPFNVVEFYTADDVDTRSTVYFDPENLNLIGLEWVIDGQAYLIQEQFGEGATLVWRDGTIEKLVFPEPQVLLTGTPDGWLMTDFGMQKLYQYQWLEDELVMTELGDYPYLKVLLTPILGDAEMDKVVSQIADL